jgi:hypothetical protein
MHNRTGAIELQNLRLKRASTVGFLAILVWFSLGGGIMLLLYSGRPMGWLSLVLGVFVLSLPLFSWFRKFWGRGNSSGAYPYLVLVPSAVLIVIYASVFSNLMSDPFVFYSEQTSFELYLWGGASALSVVAFLADLIALVLDRRRPPQGQT